MSDIQDTVDWMSQLVMELTWGVQAASFTCVVPWQDWVAEWACASPPCFSVSLRQPHLVSNVGTTDLWWQVRVLWASASRSWGKGFRASHDPALEVRQLTPTIFSWSGRSKLPTQIQEKKLGLQPFRGIANHCGHPQQRSFIFISIILDNIRSEIMHLAPCLFKKYCWFIPFMIHILFSQSVNSVAQSYPTLCDPMNCRMPGLPVRHQLLEFTQAHVH